MPRGNGKSKAKGKKTRSARAGLQFPVGRISRYLREGPYTDRVGKNAPVYMAAVLEYMAAEVLELAGNTARENKRSRIMPRHIQLAILNDTELEALNRVLMQATLSEGGVEPNIHSILLPKYSKKNRRKQSKKRKSKKKKSRK
jgi:histone H2A